jgi:dihydroorotase-like cyclic amidohydrolase
MFPLLVTAGREVELVACRTSRNTARTLGLAPVKGSLELGSRADFVIVDTVGLRAVRSPELPAQRGHAPPALYTV